MPQLMPNVRMKGSRFASIVYFVPISCPVVTHPAVDATFPNARRPLRGRSLNPSCPIVPQLMPNVRMKGSRFAPIVYFVPLSCPVVTHPAVDATFPNARRPLRGCSYKSPRSKVARMQGVRFAAVVYFDPSCPASCVPVDAKCSKKRKPLCFCSLARSQLLSSDPSSN